MLEERISLVMEFSLQQKQKAKIDKMRDQNIELLRSLACISVVLLHINAWCFQMADLGLIFRCISAIVNTFVRFGVPCFIMITGTYVFRNADKYGWYFFYKKIVKKVIVPTLCFSVLCAAYVVIKGLFNNEWLLKDTLFKWLRGIPFGHMWYMYMLIGFYLAVPILYLIRQHVSKNIWGIVGVFCFFLSFFFYNGNLIAPIWPLCWIQYVGYFIVGDFVGGG